MLTLHVFFISIWLDSTTVYLYEVTCQLLINYLVLFFTENTHTPVFLYFYRPHCFAQCFRKKVSSVFWTLCTVKNINNLKKNRIIYLVYGTDAFKTLINITKMYAFRANPHLKSCNLAPWLLEEISLKCEKMNSHQKATKFCVWAQCDYSKSKKFLFSFGFRRSQGGF